MRELFQRIHDDDKRIVLASSGKKEDTKYYIDLLKIEKLIEGYTSGDDTDHSKPAPGHFHRLIRKARRHFTRRRGRDWRHKIRSIL